MEEIKNEMNRADELYQNGKFFEASFSYQSILKDIKGKKISQEDTDLIKNRLKESILKSKNEYKELSTEVVIDETMIEQINTVNNGIFEKVGNDFSNLLTLIFSTTFIGSLESNEKTTKKTLPLTYQIASFSSHTEQGYLSANNYDYSPIELWSFQTYGMEQMMKVYFHINPILRKLTENKVFDLNSFELVLKNKGLCPNGNELVILKHAIKVYLEKDFISTLHILIPQFENLLLMISENAGIQTTAIERGKTITKRITLSDLSLKSDEMIKIFGKDFCFYLRYVLYSPLGLSIRHKIAHGNIDNAECNENNCNLVLVGLLILLNKVQKI